jgi:CRP-like cAMP-binding protein
LEKRHMAGTEPTDRLLARLPLFEHIAAAPLRALAAQSKIVEARRGEILCGRGERMPGVIALASGTAKLALRNPTGEEKVVRFVGANETFGEASALRERPCPVDMVALTDLVAVVIPAPPLLRLLEQDSRFARNAVRLMADRFLALLGELEATVQHTAVQRLAGYLDTLPAQARERPIVRLPVSKTVLAARLGVTKETLSRLLRELSERGLISVQRREIEIRDRQGLEALSLSH